ncbi:tRNA (adenine(58)-N(1))-methyltransferase non-catalytic subunit TRM6 [Engraulis encrasicolus]|uniref:tRNA (adenine(58)-N(1))-methyltransferase non-catalytic subunit TRM6 n=1 Tax=Engraulis encrasicolus TaxID=184585 RepID=UPI002FCEE700
MADNGDDVDAEYRIRDGDYIVLKRGEVYKAAQIQKKRKVIFEKQWFFLDNVVGELYGTIFEIQAGGILKPHAPKPIPSAEDNESKEAGADNRNIVDDGKSQKLTRDDIEMLKEQGLKGQEIVQQLIDNSTTFKDKTEFAQDKYIKKKKKKYDNNLTVLKPCTRILAMMYHGREPGKICHLRHDTLAQMLTQGNIHAGSKVLVFETCAGLVLGAIMERMGGYGSVVQFYPGGGPARAGMENFGFPPHFHETLHDFPLCKVNALLAGRLGAESGPEASGEPQEELQDGADGEEEAPEESRQMEVSTEGDGEDAAEKERKEKNREKKVQERKVKMEEKRKKLVATAALLEGRDADGLVIASRFHPTPVLLGLLKFLAPSRPFVVYCQYREPLIECYTKLREQGGAISLRLTDSWLRHYQVLPNRTHPVLLMSGGGGYLLTGMTVATETDARPVKTATQAKDAEPEPASKRIRLEEVDAGTVNKSDAQ